VSESRGLSPSVGLAFVNLDTCEVVLCQINDTQSYVNTIHKLNVFLPSEILIVSTAIDPPSKMYSIILDAVDELGSSMVALDRKYYAEDKGWNFIRDLAFQEDVEAMKVALSGNFYAVCCLAAVRYCAWSAFV
jgi:DNA mismatch repair protein MSH4